MADKSLLARGEHTLDILQEAGVDEAELAEMQQAEIVFRRPPSSSSASRKGGT